MSQGTRLMLFHEDGELKQILFPKLSPLWILALISTLILFAVVMLMLALRLYHEKQMVFEAQEELHQKLLTAEIKLQQVDGSTGVAPKVVTPPPVSSTGGLLDGVFGLLMVPSGNDSDDPGSPLDIMVEKNPTVMLDGSYRYKFSVVVKRPSEAVYLGSVCGLFAGQNELVLLPNKEGQSWMKSGAGVTFDKGSKCDPFKIKSVKAFEVKVPSQLTRGVIEVFSDQGVLWHVRNLQG